MARIKGEDYSANIRGSILLNILFFFYTLAVEFCIFCCAFRMWLDFFLFYLKLREQVIVFHSIETHLIASHVFMMSEPSIIILTTSYNYRPLHAPKGFVLAVALEEQKINRRQHELHKFLCLKVFHTYENSYH